jgi:hypothetical protein
MRANFPPKSCNLKPVKNAFKIPVRQQIHFLLHIQNIKIDIKIFYIHSYMFRSIRSILGEFILSLAKVTLFRSNQKYAVTSCAVLWQHVFEGVVCVLSTGQCVTQHTQHSLKLMLPQYCTACKNVFLLITSTKV